jgi:16S rRNA (guanine527-N7)-methyltransferase
MDTARIADLLQPFLESGPDRRHSDSAITGAPSRGCHSEPATAGEEPAVLSTAQLESISTYIDILLRWNARINLTAIRNPEDIVPRHFGESLFAARQLLPAGLETLQDPRENREGHGFSRATAAQERRALAPEAAKGRRLADQRPATPDHLSVADVGSGAGFPGLPLKLWAPQVSLTLIESNYKKATFLREVVRSLTLTDVDIKNTRAEELSETFDLVTLRAVEDFDSILPIAATLVAPGGQLALLIGSSQVSNALTLLPDVSWATPIPIPLSRARVLAVSEPRTI